MSLEIYKIDTLFQYESGEGYRCLYPDTLQGYPTSVPGYLFVLKRKNYGEMIYITKIKYIENLIIY